MKISDQENISKIYLENVTPQNIPEEEQKKIADFFVQLVLKVEKGDKEALKILNLPNDQLLQQIQSQMGLQQEAFENIRSRVGGLIRGTGPAYQRYNILLKTIQKNLWELGQDIQSTKDQNNITSYQNLISQVQAVEPTMVPTPGSLQKLGYSIGKGVGAVGKIAGTIAGAGLIASTLSTVGLPMAAVGAIVGGGISTLKNLSNTNMTPGEKIKKALISAGLGAVTAYALSELRDAMSGGGSEATPSDATTGTITSVDIDSVMNDESYLKELIYNYAVEQNMQSGSYVDPNVRITDQYIIFNTPNGESHVSLFDLKDNISNSIDFNQTPNGLSKYIIDAAQELKQ